MSTPAARKSSSQLMVKIVRCVSDDFPAFVECVFTDATGAMHTFMDKASVVSLENLDQRSLYPQPGFIGCEVQDAWEDAAGRPLLRVDTSVPWGVESTLGQTSFVVLASQVPQGEDDKHTTP